MWCSTGCTARACRGRRAPEGQRLEAEAHAVERFVRGDDPEPLVAPIRTLRATPGDPRIDSGGFTRAVTEPTRRTRRGAVGCRGRARVPASAGRKRRMASAVRRVRERSVSASRSSKTNGRTSDYARGRGGPAPDRDRGENDRHLKFVHDWQATDRRPQAVAAAEDARLSLAYEQSRGGHPDAATDSHEFDRHLQYVNQSQGGEEEEEIVLVSGGLGTALGTDHGHPRSLRPHAGVDRRRRGTSAADEAVGGHARRAGGSGPEHHQCRAGPSGDTRDHPVHTHDACRTGHARDTDGRDDSGTPSSSPGGTEAHWEDFDDIQLPDPAKDKDTGWGGALGLLAPVLSHYDADYSHDSHFGQHLVPAQPAAAHPRLPRRRRRRRRPQHRQRPRPGLRPPRSLMRRRRSQRRLQQLPVARRRRQRTTTSRPPERDRANDRSTAPIPPTSSPTSTTRTSRTSRRCCSIGCRRVCVATSSSTVSEPASSPTFARSYRNVVPVLPRQVALPEWHERDGRDRCRRRAGSTRRTSAHRTANRTRNPRSRG